MRILILGQYFWPEPFPIAALAKSLQGRGATVEILTGQPNYPQGQVYPGYQALSVRSEEYEGMPVFRMPLFPRGEKSGLRLALNYLSFVLSGLLVAPWLLRKRPYDLIFVYAPSPILQALPAIWLGRLKRAKTVLWVQDLWPESLSATGYVAHGGVLDAVRSVVRFIYRRMDLLLVQSHAFVAPVQALAGTTPVTYYPNSVDDSFIHPPEAAEAPPAIPGLGEPGVFSVLFAGNIGSAQSVETILEAAALLKERDDIRFIMVGSGSRSDWMREQAQARGLRNLVMAGRFPVQTMPGLMRQASALLVTLSRHPIFEATVPSKVQAYLASGRPIVAALDGEGARVIADAQAGRAVPAENPKALADAVAALAALPAAQREALGHNGRNYCAQHFDHGMLTQRLLDHFAELVRNKDK
jgi:glycosyltransferase involved in cell wall biosynthesis